MKCDFCENEAEYIGDEHPDYKRPLFLYCETHYWTFEEAYRATFLQYKPTSNVVQAMRKLSHTHAVSMKSKKGQKLYQKRLVAELVGPPTFDW